MLIRPSANGCESPDTPLDPAQRLKKLETELAGLDSRLRGFMQAENPAEGVCYAEDIHKLRQEKLQKRLEMDYCAAQIRFLQAEGARYPQ